MSEKTHLQSTSPDHDVTLHWFLPTYGDSRGITAGGHGAGNHVGNRKADLRYLTQLALAAETNGFDSVLIPTGAWCADAWVIASTLAAATERLKFLVALRPGLASPTLAAQQAATLADLSGGRVLVNVVVGGENHEQRSFGDHLDKAARYARAGEELAVIRRLWAGEAVDFHGDHVHVEGAALANPPAAAPPVFFGGSSDPALAVAGSAIDVYLTWGEPARAVAEKKARVDAAAARAGRTVDHGIRLHVITRDTSEEAWAEAARLQRGLDPREVRRIQEGLARSQSEGQRRMAELHGRGAGFDPAADPRSLEVAPNLWAGVGLVRGGAGTALVGSHDEVAERIAEYRDLGMRHFILSGYPHLEEAYHVGEGLVAALHRRGIGVTGRSGAADDALHDSPVPFLKETA